MGSCRMAVENTQSKESLNTNPNENYTEGAGGEPQEQESGGERKTRVWGLMGVWRRVPGGQRQTAVQGLGSCSPVTGQSSRILAT